MTARLRTVLDNGYVFHLLCVPNWTCICLVEVCLVCIPGLWHWHAPLCAFDHWHYALSSFFSFLYWCNDSSACAAALFHLPVCPYGFLFGICYYGFALEVCKMLIFFSPFLYLLSSFVGKAFSLRGVNVRIAIHYIAIILCFIGFLSFILLYMSFLYAHFMLW